MIRLDPKGDGRALEERLDAAESFSRNPNPSAAWAFRGEGVVATFYSSGKLVVQGRGADDFAARFATGSAESRGGARETLDSDLIGTDESGKGDYFGPLVVAAVLVPKGQERVLAELGVRDSKQLSDSAAKEIAGQIRAGYPHEIVVIGPERYNEIYPGFGNLNRLLGWATAKAIAGVLEKRPCRNVLSDKFGNERHIADALAKMGIEVNLVQRVRAESNPAVAAASIVARDAFLGHLARLSRQTGSKLPKGAGSPVLTAGRKIYHEGGREALRKVAKLHFKTTEQVARLL